VEDRRGFGPTAAVGGGLGLTGLLVVLAVNFLGGGNITDVLSSIDPNQLQTQETTDSGAFAGDDEYETFVSTVLGSNNDTWEGLFAANNKTYSPPKLVLFRESTQSACGGATSDVGPHYCPLDQTAYLDETFFEELVNRFHAKGGDVAEAYVIAHEVGHHVQNQLGSLDESSSNAASVRTELQADCFAGIWANSIKDSGVFEAGEIEEALNAAAAVGDDRIQEAVNGRVNPETWTHGSSEARVDAFMTGYDSGSPAQCGTNKLPNF
jgi:predicted metalloprotease